MSICQIDSKLCKCVITSKMVQIRFGKLNGTFGFLNVHLTNAYLFQQMYTLLHSVILFCWAIFCPVFLLISPSQWRRIVLISDILIACYISTSMNQKRCKYFQAIVLLVVYEKMRTVFSLWFLKYETNLKIASDPIRLYR